MHRWDVGVTAQNESRSFNGMRGVVGVKGLLFRAATRMLFHSHAMGVANRFANVYDLSGDGAAPGFPYIRKRRGRNLQILIYHRVNDEGDRFFPGIPTGVFAQQMEYLASQWNVLPLEEALERLKRQDVPDNAIVITFDDGYRDNFLMAFPILRRLSLPATIFLATGVIGTGLALWHDRVFSAFRETRVPVLTGMPNEHDQYDLQTIAHKLAAQGKILRFIWSLGEDDRTRWIDQLVLQLNVSGHQGDSRVMLTWDEIRLMHSQGISFGAHTVTHPILSRLSLPRAVEELLQSKAAIERELQAPASAFAYPIGRQEDYSEDTKRLVQEAGYTCALTTVPGTNTARTDPFALRRATPWDEDISAFAFRLNYFKLAS